MNRFTINGLSLKEWCKRNGKSYYVMRNRLSKVFNFKPKISEKVKQRMRAGYTKEEAELPDYEFKKLHKQRFPNLTELEKRRRRKVAVRKKLGHPFYNVMIFKCHLSGGSYRVDACHALHSGNTGFNRCIIRCSRIK